MTARSCGVLDPKFVFSREVCVWPLSSCNILRVVICMNSAVKYAPVRTCPESSVYTAVFWSYIPVACAVASTSYWIEQCTVERPQAHRCNATRKEHNALHDRTCLLHAWRWASSRMTCLRCSRLLWLPRTKNGQCHAHSWNSICCLMYHHIVVMYHYIVVDFCCSCDTEQCIGDGTHTIVGTADLTIFHSALAIMSEPAIELGSEITSLMWTNSPCFAANNQIRTLLYSDRPCWL